MGKEVVLHDRVSIDGTDVSVYVRGIEHESENQEVDASGMTESGNDEMLAGNRVAAVVLDMMIGTEMHALLYPLHRDREVFPIEVQDHGLVDPTRETLVGNAQLLTFPKSASRGEVRSASIRLTPGDDAGFDWVTPT